MSKTSLTGLKSKCHKDRVPSGGFRAELSSASSVSRSACVPWLMASSSIFKASSVACSDSDPPASSYKDPCD